MVSDLFEKLYMVDITTMKPVGGRGKVAPEGLKTTMRRIPEGIKLAVEALAALYREGQWDGRFESLNLISGNREENYKPDIKNDLAELEDLRQWKHRSLPLLAEVGDLRESLRDMQRANIQTSNELAKAVEVKVKAEEAKRMLATRVDELDRENLGLHEKNGDLNLQVQLLQEEIIALKSTIEDFSCVNQHTEQAEKAILATIDILEVGLKAPPNNSKKAKSAILDAKASIYKALCLIRGE